MDHYIKNMINATVFYKVEGTRTRRSFGPGRVYKIDEDEYRDVLSVSGIREMITNGVLAFTDAKGKLITDESNEDSSFVVMDKDMVVQMLTNGTPSELNIALRDAAPATRELIVNTAVELKVGDASRAAIIKKNTGKDIISMISKNEEAKG